jgi:hypothetical protein
MIPGSIRATQSSFSVAATDAVCQDPSVNAILELGPGDWMLWRALRIEATTTEPDACGSTIDEVAATTEAQWRARLAEPSLHLVACQGIWPSGWPLSPTASSSVRCGCARRSEDPGLDID